VASFSSSFLFSEQDTPETPALCKMAELRPRKRAREDDTGGVSETEEQSSRRAPVVVFAHGAGGNSSHEWMVRSGSYPFVSFSSTLLLSNCEMLSLPFFSSVSFSFLFVLCPVTYYLLALSR